MIRRIVTVGIAALVIAAHFAGQQTDSELTKLRKLSLLESPGPVPVLYVPSAKERAVRFQKSLEAAHSWYEKQLNVRVPLTLAILDSEAWAKDVAKYPMAHSEPFSGLVVLPDYTDGIRPGHTDGVQALPGADPDHAPDGILAGEHVLFHEAGHVFAYTIEHS